VETPIEVAVSKKRTIDRRTGLVVSVIAALGLLGAVHPTDARAGIQLGQIASQDSVLSSCGPDKNLVQAAAPVPFTVPFPGGVITEWSHRGDVDDTPGSGRLQLWGPAGAPNYTLVGRSALQAFTADVVNVFPTRIPVTGGEQLGLRAVDDPACGYLEMASSLAGETTATDPLPGETRSLATPFVSFVLNVEAVLEPDADGDGFGDETQDDCPGQPDGSAGCPSNQFRFGKLKLNRKKGTARLKVKVPGPGELELAKTKKLKGKSRRAKEAGARKLPIKPTRRAKKRLRRKGKLGARAKVTYTPDGGQPNEKGERVRLRKR
jgi:hypothetical protein